MRQALALLVLSALALGQDAEAPDGPKALFRAFFDLSRQAAAGDAEAMTRAGRLFDLSDVNRADRDVIGRRAANYLSQFLDRLEYPIAEWELPSRVSDPTWTYETKFGPILVARVEDGSWRFSKQTRQGVEELYAKVATRTPRQGRESWIDRLPAWMHGRVFLLANWQWLGLLALILLGYIAAFLGSFVFFKAAQRMARLRGVELQRGRRVGRPFGLVAMAALWWFGLEFLLLPERAYLILILAARVVLMVGAVWSVTRIVDWVMEVLAGLATRTSSRFDDLLIPMVRKALKVFVVAMGVVWIADNLDMNVGALLAGLGVGGLALALAARDAVANFFGALTVLADRPFEVGDWILMGDIEGTVESVGFRSTRVRTFYNSLISFPNSMVTTTAVDNLGRRQYRRLKTTLGVTYDTPADKLETFIEGIRELIRRHPYTRKDYYHVYFHGFGASSLDVLVYMFFRAPDWATELRERQRFLMDVLRLANGLGVEFAFPTRKLHMIRGEAPDHGAPTDDLVKAWRKGQGKAKEIVDTFTGDRVPPPVRIGQRPDEALGDDGE